MHHPYASSTHCARRRRLPALTIQPLFITPSPRRHFLPHATTQTQPRTFPCCLARKKSSEQPSSKKPSKKARESHMDAPTPPGTRGAKRPYGYWKHTTNVLRELHAHLTYTHGNISAHTIMPTQTELQRAGRSDLACALQRHGWANVASLANLRLSSIARPRSLNLALCTDLQLASGRMRPYMYWRDFRNVHRELTSIMQATNTDGDGNNNNNDDDDDDNDTTNTLPSASVLRALGRSDLVRAIRMHGGWYAVAERMGARCASSSYVRRHAARLPPQAVRHPLPPPQQQQTSPRDDRTPLANDVPPPPPPPPPKKQTKRQSNNSSRRQTDGRRQQPATQKSKWESNEMLMHAVHQAVEKACEKDGSRAADVMVTRRELMQIERADLARVVTKVGFRKMAAICGLRMSRRRQPQALRANASFLADEETVK